jgi:hypothetical protein
MLVLELRQARLGLFGELIHQRVAAMVAQRILKDALTILPGLGDLKASGVVMQSLATACAVAEGLVSVV